MDTRGSLDDQARQSKKPCRVPLEMFLHSQGRPSLLIHPSAPAPLRLSPIPPQQGHRVWMLSPPLRDEQSSRHLPVASSQPFAGRWLCALRIYSRDWTRTATWQTTQWMIKRRVEMNGYWESMGLFDFIYDCRGITEKSCFNIFLINFFFFLMQCMDFQEWSSLTPIAVQNRPYAVTWPSVHCKSAVIYLFFFFFLA